MTEIENVIAMVFAHCRHSPLVRPSTVRPPPVHASIRPRTRCLRACGHVKVEEKWPKSTARSEGRASERRRDVGRRGRAESVGDSLDRLRE